MLKVWLSAAMFFVPVFAAMMCVVFMVDGIMRLVPNTVIESLIEDDERE